MAATSTACRIDMYEKHFGLNSRPFGARAEGPGVFVGPRQTDTISKLGKGLQAHDAVVTVTGPVGVGKTTIVNRALASVSPDRTVVRIGRMQLGRDEILVLLLAGCGITQSPTGTIQQFAAFRRHLHEKASAGVTIVVEDAHRVGIETLAEIETLTAADAGDDASASVIIMGQSGLHDLLATPDLARLKQRNRLRQNIEALSMAEVLGYLKHSMRNAGRDFSAVFDDGVADIVFGCSEGIPRIINTLCETALTTAAEDNATSISTALMQKVAADAFGYEDASTSIAAPAPVDEEIASESTDDVPRQDEQTEDVDWETLPVAEFQTEAEIVHKVVVESGSYPVTPESEAAAPDEAPEEVIAEEIPELIEDTQPEIAAVDSEKIAPEAADPNRVDDDELDLDAALSPETDSTNIMPGVTRNLDAEVRLLPRAASETALQEPEVPHIATSPVEQESPDLAASMRVDVEKIVGNRQQPAATVTPIANHVAAADLQQEPARTEEPVPEPEPVIEPDPVREPEAVREPNPVREPEAEIVPEPVPEPAMEEAVIETEADSDAPTDVSPILSVSNTEEQVESDVLEAALDAALEAVEQGDFATDTAGDSTHELNEAARIESPEAEAPAEQKPDAVELIADEPEANVDLADFARQIGSASSLEDMSDFAAETLFGCESLNEIAAHVVANPPSNEDSHAASDEHSTSIMLTDEELSADSIANVTEEPAANQDLPPPEPATTTSSPDHLRESVAMRIDMLQSLNSKPDTVQPKAQPIAQAKASDAPPAPKSPTPTGPQLEPIERQINTSMTQTLEALNVARETDEDDTKKKSGGFFGLFKKSS